MNTPRSFVEPVAATGTSAPRRGPGLWRPFNPPITNWRGQRVWIVGASTGIGRAASEQLLAHGATVLASARSAAGLEELVARHTRTGEPSRVQAWPLDATDAASVSRAAQAILAQGPVDVVLYCAGHYRGQRADTFDLAEMQRHMAINYGGALNLLNAVLPAFLARGQGHISLVSSVAGFRGLPQGLAYGPTKAALTHLAETLYLDLAPRGIGVSVVHPGFVKTPLTAQNEFEMPALITPEVAARELLAGIAAGAFDIHFPKRFTRWMKLLRLLPYRAYFPLVHRATGL
ncbi:SDR family NAD(P)-dependent oxidoreductase [Hydrogenophaga sp. RWCD_12]|uniref:SDR family NAD(P)-dependent oxidoreductase n=1 Tax=Hydrogenophaga sp. RWCD_12 TaxID=3391190 RepID=UPI0039848484